jgi:hypothetical protein
MLDHSSIRSNDLPALGIGILTVKLLVQPDAGINPIVIASECARRTDCADLLARSQRDRRRHLSLCPGKTRCGPSSPTPIAVARACAKVDTSLLDSGVTDLLRRRLPGGLPLDGVSRPDLRRADVGPLFQVPNTIARRGMPRVRCKAARWATNSYRSF